MKKVLDRLYYDFNAIDKTVSFNLPIILEKKDILMIVNLTDNQVIYNFADETKRGAYSGNVLTLTYDTTLMSNSDELMIIIQDKDKNTEDLLQSVISELKQLNEFAYLINEKL